MRRIIQIIVAVILVAGIIWFVGTCAEQNGEEPAESAVETMEEAGEEVEESVEEAGDEVEEATD